MKFWTLFVLLLLTVSSCAGDEQPGKTGGTTLGEGEDEPLDGGSVEPVADLPKPKEKDVVQAIYGSRNNKPMRLVGVVNKDAVAVVDSEVGRVVEVTEVPVDAMCTVLFEAPVKKDSNPPVPSMPAFGDFDGREMRPVQVPESRLDANWVWFTLLRGPDCTAMAAHGQFLGSDLHSILKLPVQTQRRILKAEVSCEPESGSICVVPIDDPRVKPDSHVFLPIQLAGRPDLNFVSKRDGQVEVRVEEPEDGWGLGVPR